MTPNFIAISSSGILVCTWESIRPGRRVQPAASMTLASDGMAESMPAMMPSLMRIVLFWWKLLPSNTRTCFIMVAILQTQSGL